MFTAILRNVRAMAIVWQSCPGRLALKLYREGSEGVKGRDRPREKWTPHYDLLRLQELAREKLDRIAMGTAGDGARDAGLDLNDIWSCILLLKRNDFYKSMTSYDSYSVW